MADIELTHEHDKDVETLYEKADELFSNQDRVESVEWNDDRTRATVTGTGFEGVVEIREDEVSTSIELGMMAKPFKDAIEQQLRGQLDELFGR